MLSIPEQEPPCLNDANLQTFLLPACFSEPRRWLPLPSEEALRERIGGRISIMVGKRFTVTSRSTRGFMVRTTHRRQLELSFFL